MAKPVRHERGAVVPTASGDERMGGVAQLAQPACAVADRREDERVHPEGLRRAAYREQAEAEAEAGAGNRAAEQPD